MTRKIAYPTQKERRAELKGEMADARGLVVDRDGGACVSCFSRNGVQWHHLMNRNPWKQLVCEPSFTLLLCYACHANPLCDTKPARGMFLLTLAGRYYYTYDSCFDEFIHEAEKVLLAQSVIRVPSQEVAEHIAKMTDKQIVVVPFFQMKW